MRVKYLEDSLITAKADELLNDYRPSEGSLEVDVIGIATNKLGLSIHFADLQLALGEGTLGMIVPSAKSILCDTSLEPYGKNKENNERVQRFTIAHELGHYMLHREYMNDNESLFYQDLPKNEHKKMETQANMYAARLLMPASAFRPFYDYHLRRGECPIFTMPKIISAAFNVSLDAAFFRSKALNYVT